MKKEYRFLLASLFFFLAFLSYYYQIHSIFISTSEFLFFFSFAVLIALASFLLGSLNKGKAISLNQLSKGEKIEILKNYHPANYKLGDKRNKSYYIIKRGTDNKIYLFSGPENYQHLPYKRFNFIWDGKKLQPLKN